MKKKAAKAGKAKVSRKRSPVKDLSAKKAGAKGGVLIGLLLPAVQKVGDGSVRNLTGITDGTSNTLLKP